MYLVAKTLDSDDARLTCKEFASYEKAVIRAEDLARISGKAFIWQQIEIVMLDQTVPPIHYTVSENGEILPK